MLVARTTDAPQVDCCFGRRGTRSRGVRNRSHTKVSLTKARERNVEECDYCPALRPGRCCAGSGVEIVSLRTVVL